MSFHSRSRFRGLALASGLLAAVPAGAQTPSSPPPRTADPGGGAQDPAKKLPTPAPSLGTEKGAAGPTFVVLKQAGPWTAGALANHIWSYGGASDRADVNQTFLQPFVSYSTPGGITLTVTPQA